jgi:hypothetical protein
MISCYPIISESLRLTILNKERLRYKLDFSWNKNTFLDYAQQNDLSLVQEIIPIEFGEHAKVLGEETVGEALKKIGSKNQSVYKKFNFESLSLLKSQSEKFFSYWERIISLRKNEKKLSNFFYNVETYYEEKYKKELDKYSGLVPLVNLYEWKIAISAIYPHVNGVKTTSYSREATRSDYGAVLVKDELLSVSFEYCLDLFWQAKEEANLSGEWGIVNPMAFLQWAKQNNYTVEELGINIYSETYEGIRSYYANFIGKSFAWYRRT